LRLDTTIENSTKMSESRALSSSRARSHPGPRLGHRHSHDSLDLNLIQAEISRILARRETNLEAIANQFEAAANMSANNNHQNNANNLFPSLEVRQAPSPTSSHAGGAQMNGNGLANASYMPPLPAGHQQDLNYLYSQIQELSGILKSNREKVNVITKTAEEVAVSCLLMEKCVVTDVGLETCQRYPEWGRR
jgi:hypothetical protein